MLLQKKQSNKRNKTKNKERILPSARLGSFFSLLERSMLHMPTEMDRSDWLFPMLALVSAAGGWCACALVRAEETRRVYPQPQIPPEIWMKCKHAHMATVINHSSNEIREEGGQRVCGGVRACVFRWLEEWGDTVLEMFNWTVIWLLVHVPELSDWISERLKSNWQVEKWLFLGSRWSD